MSLDYKSVFLISLILVQGGAENAMDVDIETDVDNSTDEDWNRIIGGSRIDITDAPYQVSFEELGQHVCGGSIISEIFIITAAHCTVGVNKTFITIRTGSYTREKGGQVSKVKCIYEHPQFKLDNLDYDISILELETPLVFSKQIQKVNLPKTIKMPEPGTMALVTGWGLIDEADEESGSLVLRSVVVPLMAKKKCKQYYRRSRMRITNRMFCAGYIMGGKDACREDSGGPLVINRKLYGIISFGLGCAWAKYPGVYTKITRVRKFIKTVTGI